MTRTYFRWRTVVDVAIHSSQSVSRRRHGIPQCKTRLANQYTLSETWKDPVCIHMYQTADACVYMYSMTLYIYICTYMGRKCQERNDSPPDSMFATSRLGGVRPESNACLLPDWSPRPLAPWVPANGHARRSHGALPPPSRDAFQGFSP